MSTSLFEFAQAKLARLEGYSRRRTPVPSRRLDSRLIERNGQQLIDFSSNDYLGLTYKPEMRAAAGAALEQGGIGAGASRLITGEHPYYQGLEAALATLKGTEDAVVFGSGYLANLGILPVLCGRNDLIMADKLNHACLLDGARLSGARLLRYPHCDLETLQKWLSRYRGQHHHCMIITDGVFSMDGDLAPLPELARLAHTYDAWLMTDDAHGLGVVGEGAGSTQAYRLTGTDIPLQMGTLSKAVGSYGGYLCTRAEVAALLRTQARSLVYTTALPPATVASAEAAVHRIRNDPALCRRPLRLARRLTHHLGRTEPASPILPILLGSAEAALRAQEGLASQGFLVQAIRPPTVPEGTARLRVAVRAPHHEADIDRLGESLQPFLDHCKAG